MQGGILDVGVSTSEINEGGMIEEQVGTGCATTSRPSTTICGGFGLCVFQGPWRTRTMPFAAFGAHVAMTATECSRARLTGEAGALRKRPNRSGIKATVATPLAGHRLTCR